MCGKEEKTLKRTNKGSIYKNKTWADIFDIIASGKNKAVWITAHKMPLKDSLFDFTIDYYILKCDGGFKNKIPTELNEYIKKNNLAEAV